MSACKWGEELITKIFVHRSFCNTKLGFTFLSLVVINFVLINELISTGAQAII